MENAQNNQVQSNVQILRVKTQALKAAREELKTLKQAHKQQLVQARQERMQQREEKAMQREEKRVATVAKLEAKLSELKSKAMQKMTSELVGTKKIKADKKPSKVVIVETPVQKMVTDDVKANVKKVRNSRKVSNKPMMASNVSMNEMIGE